MIEKENKPKYDRAIWVVVIFILALLTCVAVPSFVKSRNTSSQEACLNNLRIIDEGKEQAAMAYRLSDSNGVQTAK